MKLRNTGTIFISSFGVSFRRTALVLMILIIPVSFLFFAGCDNPVEKGGDEVINALKRSQSVADNATVNALNNAAQTFKTMNSKYPDSIEQLERFTGEQIDREKFEYDPVEGKISLKK